MDGCALIAFEGEYDLSNRDDLRRRIAAAALDESLIVDLHAVTFLDSSALAEIVLAAHRHEAHGSRLVLARPSPQVLRLLEIAGLDSTLDVADSLEAARRRCERRVLSQGEEES